MTITTNANGNGTGHTQDISPQGRTLPVDINAERATLGAILLDRDVILEIAPVLSPGDFYLQKHEWIYEAALACLHRRVPPDLSTIADDLRRRERLALVGGISYLAELSAEVPTAAHADYYASIVERTAIRRRLIECGGQITAFGYDERDDLAASLNQAEAALFAVSQWRQGDSDFTPASDVVSGFFEEMTTRPQRVIPTGFLDLDRMLNGFKAGQLVILAARPSMGKSALAHTVLWHLAVKQRYQVALVSLEMSKSEIMARLLAYETDLDLRRIDALWSGLRPDGAAEADDPDTEGDRQQMLDRLGALSEGTFHLEDHSEAKTINAIRSKARRMALRYGGIDLLIVDYLQLMQCSDGGYRPNNRNDEIGYLSRQLKLLAGELRCPVLVLSQLSRKVEDRTNKVPMLSDLRDSGAIEQDADMVIFIYREEVYDRETDQKGIAELHVAKHRNGPTGVVPLGFNATTTRFVNLARGRRVEGYD